MYNNFNFLYSFKKIEYIKLKVTIKVKPYLKIFEDILLRFFYEKNSTQIFPFFK